MHNSTIRRLSATSASEFTYEFPMASTSCPAKPTHGALRRHHSRSPSPAGRRLSKPVSSTRAADIARILDPSYAGREHEHAVRVYVDRHGVVHDPNYRPFPVVVPQRPVRPAWEIAGDESALEEEDGDEYAASLPTYTKSRHHRDSVSTYRSYASHAYTTPPSTPSYSPSTSFDSDVTIIDEVDPFLDDSCSGVKKLSPKCRRASRARAEEEKMMLEMEAEQRASVEVNDERCLFSDSEKEARQIELPEWTPSCTDSLRRQCQAVSLKVRFGVFKIQRRMRSVASKG